MNPLHHVDVPRGATTYDRERDCPQRNCIVETITWYMNVLKSNDSLVPKNSLRWIILFTLWVISICRFTSGFSMTWGGTKTKVTFQGKAQTPHALWDSGMLEKRRHTRSKQNGRTRQRQSRNT